MAKRRFFRKARAKVSRAVRYVRSKARRHVSSSGAVKPIQLDAMAWGLARPYFNGLTAPVTDIVDNYIPTDIAQPLVNGTISYLVAKNSSGMIKEVAKKALTAENYELGKSLGTRFLGTPTTQTIRATNSYVIG